MADEDVFMMENDGNSLDNVFKRAADFVAENAPGLKQADLLYLYGRFKIITCGACKEPMPGILKIKNRSKWSAWNCLGNMTKKEAMQQYVDKLTEMSPEWDIKTEKEERKPKSRFGPVTSTCLKLDPELEHSAKTVFDFVKEGNLHQVQQLISTCPTLKDSVDDNGLSLLHWACDRGNNQVACYLISAGSDIDHQDKDGQTPLHYASSCGHEDVIKLLLEKGASINVFDSDGLTPVEVAYNTAVKELLAMQPV